MITDANTKKRPGKGARYSLLLLPVAVCAIAPAGKISAADPFPEGPGKAEFLKVCTQCHAAEPIATLRYSTEDWRDLVFDMKGKGADATDEECNTIVEYLAKNFPKDDAKK